MESTARGSDDPAPHNDTGHTKVRDYRAHPQVQPPYVLESGGPTSVSGSEGAPQDSNYDDWVKCKEVLLEHLYLKPENRGSSEVSQSDIEPRP